jgi:hypothetical protein
MNRCVSIHRSGFARPACAVALLVAAVTTQGAVQTVIGFNQDGEARPGFSFTNVPAPSKVDAATTARFSIAAGERDENSGFIKALNDGRLPSEADEPGGNFFFAGGGPEGRLVADLGQVIAVKAVNSYSWHPAGRGPQVYKLYASDGDRAGFNPKPDRSVDLDKSGWKLVAAIDTRTKFAGQGGQYGVSIAESAGVLGKYRYLLFDVATTDSSDPFGQTFFSEIDVIDANAAAQPVAEPAVEKASGPLVVKSADGYCEIKIDTSGAPELSDWAEHKLAPVLAEWYPKIVAMMPSEGFVAPKEFSVNIRPGDGVAATGGTRITANSKWLQGQLPGEALGAIVHEVVHVVQQYGGGRQRNAPGTRPPGWLVEGIPDYIRFFKYEPQIHGADLYWVKGRRNLTLNYDKLYRISANFLNHVVEGYDRDQTLMARVNAACRDRKYSDAIWQELTGKSLTDLNDEWKSAVRQQLAALAGEGSNTLSATEQAAGWKLLFNGTNLAGWSNFKRTDVRAGWQVKDGALVCADPHNAGDIVTSEKFSAFELELDYNISPGGNSGIIFHVTDEGGAVWATGPEFQLEDNAKAADPQRCGWLYALYQPPVDPRTDKPVDATLAAGEWNHVRLVISPERCEHWINGVKYFDYALGSEDFKQRVAASKFSKMPLFAKSGAGYLALQGDHGEVSFRNIKVRSLPAKTATR